MRTETNLLIEDSRKPTKPNKFKLGDRVKADDWRGTWIIEEIDEDLAAPKPYGLLSEEVAAHTHFPTKQGSIPLSKKDREIRIWEAESKLSIIR